MDLELERFLENQTEMLGNLTITDSICIDTLRDICERYCELKKLRVGYVSNRRELLIAFMESLTTEDLTQIEIAEFENVANKFLGN